MLQTKRIQKVKALQNLLEKYSGKKVILIESNQDDPDYNRLYSELVPKTGKATTIEGEMLRAISKIGYRLYNDGDIFYRGYGVETCGPAYRYLVSKQKLIPTVIAALRAAKAANVKERELNYKTDPYTINIEKAVTELIKYIKSKQGNYTSNETEDMLQTPIKKRNTSSPSYSSRRRY